MLVSVEHCYLENALMKIGTIVLKPGPARQVDSGLEPGQVEEKIEKEKNPV